MVTAGYRVCLKFDMSPAIRTRWDFPIVRAILNNVLAAIVMSTIGSQDAEGWSTAGGVGLEGHVIYTTPL